MLFFIVTVSVFCFFFFVFRYLLQDNKLFSLQEVAVKKFLQQDLSGDALEEFRTEVYSSLDVIPLA